MRDHEESSPLEVAYGANDEGFVIKNFGELMKGTSLTSSKILGDIYPINCTMEHDDMLFNVSSACSLMYMSDFTESLFNLLI